MSRKYVGQQSDYNFVYPNNDPKQYDVEIIHDINNYSVSGTVTNFTGTSISSTGMTVSFNWSWTKNGAEPFISDSGNINLLSVHMMGDNQAYFKPWRLVEYVNDATTGSTSYTGTTSFTVTPSQIGLSAFVNDDYYFEIRFIGHRAIYPICQTLTVSSITPPTPTPSMTPMTPTPTPTPSATPSVINYTSGATLNVTDTGWIKYNMSTGSTYQYIGSTGTVTLTNCLDCDTIMVGIPFADVAAFTVTDCGSSCSAPTPTPGTTATLAWSFTESNAAAGYMDLYVNGSIVESRSTTSSGTYAVNVGDTINVEVYCDTCNSPNNYSNVYTEGIIADASCANGSSTSIFTAVYTVVSGDVGTTLTLATHAKCDSGCV